MKNGLIDARFLCASSSFARLAAAPVEFVSMAAPIVRLLHAQPTVSRTLRSSLSWLPPIGPLVDLVIVDLAFLAPRCHRHAYAFAGVRAARGTVPTFFTGIDQVAQFAMDQPGAGDQRTD